MGVCMMCRCQAIAGSTVSHMSLCVSRCCPRGSAFRGKPRSYQLREHSWGIGEGDLFIFKTLQPCQCFQSSELQEQHKVHISRSGETFTVLGQQQVQTKGFKRAFCDFLGFRRSRSSLERCHGLVKWVYQNFMPAGCRNGNKGHQGLLEHASHTPRDMRHATRPTRHARNNQRGSQELIGEKPGMHSAQIKVPAQKTRWLHLMLSD